MNMNFTQSFEEFSSSLGVMDVALYAGVGLVLWVLFKDKLSPVQALLVSLFDTVKSVVPKPTGSTVVVPPVVSSVVSAERVDDVFFRLVVSWKQTRDLAEASGCSEAVEVADQMFPFLSPTVCKEGK
jgi:hypothetical protein